MSGTCLLADVGGTNVRFCLSRAAGEISDIAAFVAAAHPTFSDAMTHYLRRAEVEKRDQRIVEVRIAAAGPVDGDRVALTNAPWQIDAAEIQRGVGAPVRLHNDLEAVGYLLPHIRDADVAPIGGRWRQQPRATRIAVNLGTGLGAATAHATRDGGWVITASEAGHMSCALPPPLCAALGLDMIASEELLSGTGLVDCYRKLAARRGEDAGTIDAAAILARPAGDKAAQLLADNFAEMLGRVTGDLVLANAAWGGVFLCGSVASGWSVGGDQTGFRHAFEAKGKMHARMQQVPTWCITQEHPALLGLSHART